MSALAKEIRRLPVAGSGDTAANSRVEEKRETAIPGPAPGSYVTPIYGGELHVIDAGRRMAVQIRTGRGLRNRLTASMAPDEAELWFRQGLELTINNRLARAQRDSKKD